MSTVHTRAQLKLDEGYKLIVQEITSTGDFATCIQLKPLSEINRMLVEADPAGFKVGLQHQSFTLLTNSASIVRGLG
jgi:hypothetical protein